MAEKYWEVVDQVVHYIEYYIDDGQGIIIKHIGTVMHSIEISCALRSFIVLCCRFKISSPFMFLSQAKCMRVKENSGFHSSN